MLEPGDIVDGKYRVVQLLGVGGMGSVYEGHNLRIDRRIAIKVMHASIAQQHDAVARFEREAQAAARIGSRHIVDVFDLGDLPGGERFMVMELLVGESLLSRFKSRGPMPVAEAARIVIQLLDGLAKVHDAGIVHRDLKPANVFLAESAQQRDLVKILDFGVCKILHEQKPGEIFTGIGDVLGTLPYMSPEQLEHGPHRLDRRSDLYAVGILLYRALSGRLPYQASNLVSLMAQLRAGKGTPIGDVIEVDPAFAAIVARATEWDAAARYQSASAFQQALVDWLASSRRLEHLLTDFLEAPPVGGGAPEPPPARAQSTHPSEAPTDPFNKRVEISILPPPRTPARRSPKAAALPGEGARSKDALAGDTLPPPPRRLRKASSRGMNATAPPPLPPNTSAAPDEEEMTLKQVDPTRKRPRRA